MNAIFFDRDGVINRRLVDDYVKSWDEFEFIPDIFSVLPLVKHAGFLTVIASNQRGIARGLMTEDDLHAVHNRMQEYLQMRCGHTFDEIYYCPHNTEDGCDCRKPKPGMLLRAAREHDILLERSWFIGDSESDVEAGHGAGCRTVKIDEHMRETRADILVTSLTEAWDMITKQL